jgi:hypothetical protein
MWHEVGRSAATGGQRVPRSHVSSAGPPPNGSFKLRCCRNRMMSMHSRGSLVSRWQNWIRAWGRGEPATNHSAARTVEWAALACSRVDWTSQVRGPLHPGFSRFRGRMTAASTRRHALGRMAVSRLKMRHFSLCTIAQSEPSRGGAGTWHGRFSRRPLPGADGFVFNTNRRGFESESNGKEEHAGLALLDGVMDQLHKRGTTAVQSALRSTPGTARNAGRH